MMDISELAKTAGLAASTIRYYEQLGLIRSLGRRGLRRQFGDDAVERLALIALGRRAGFSLHEIGAMFTPDGPEIDRKLLLDRAGEVDRRIRELSAIRDGLRHAAVCEAPSHLECPKFLRLLRVVGMRRFRPKNRSKLPSAT